MFETSAADITIPQVFETIENPSLAEWKRLPLDLIVLVDGLIVCGDKNLKFKPKYVKMMRTSHTSSILFGAGSHFIKTLSRLTLPQPTVYISEPLSKLWWLKQQTTACYGFPATNSFWNNPYACWKDSQTKKTLTVVTQQ